MKKKILGLVLAASMLSAGTASALTFDADVTNEVIFGSGNLNGSFTVDQNSNQGIELGLRGKLRHNASGLPENTFNSNGDGTYSFDAGVAPGQTDPAVAVWSFEWSINSSFNGHGPNLNVFTYELGIDSDPTSGTTFSTFDPINDGDYWDHSIGTNTTANGAGAEATTAAGYAALIAANNLAQNSWKAHWFIDPFDPTVDGTYDFYLKAFGEQNTLLAETRMQIIVGDGASAVPSPATFLLLLSGLISMGVVRFRGRARTAA